MIAYDRMTDEELILILRDGDGKVIDFIIEKYKELVRRKAGSMFILGADREDLIQEVWTPRPRKAPGASIPPTRPPSSPSPTGIPSWMKSWNSGR